MRGGRVRRARRPHATGTRPAPFLSSDPVFICCAMRAGSMPVDFGVHSSISVGARKPVVCG